MNLPRLRTLSLLSASLLTAAVASAQTSPAAKTFDLLALDGKGAPIEALKPSDLRLSLDGHIVDVASLDKLPAPTAAQPERIVLLFDEMLISERHQYEEAAEKLIASASPTRQFAVVRYDDYASLKRLQDFTSDVSLLTKAVRIPVTTSNRAAYYLHEALETQRSGRLQTTQWRSETQDLIHALHELSADLAKTPGRKLVILMSPGLIYANSQTDDVIAAGHELSRSGAVLYAVKALEMRYDVYNYFALYEPLAKATGGRLIESSQEPSQVLLSIIDEQSHRYQVTAPAPAKCEPLAVQPVQKGLKLYAPTTLCPAK